MTQTVQWPLIGGNTFPIPEDGETNWPDLTEYLVALSEAQGTRAQKVAVRAITTTPASIAAGSDCFVSVELPVPAPVTINLPAGNIGQYFGIIDGLSVAGTHNITVLPAPGETIQGLTEYVMNANGAAAGFIFFNGDWKISWQAAGEGAGGGVARSSIDSATPNYVLINDPSGKLSQEQYLSVVRGGLGLSAAGAVGYVKFSAGVPSFIASIPGTDLSGGIAASKIGNGDVDNPTLSRLSGVTSPIQTQIDGKQGIDADLTALAALATAGVAVRTGPDTWSLRTLQAGSARVQITNPGGVAGDPTIDVVEANIAVQNLGGTALPISKGGTGQTTAQAALNALLPAQTGNNAKFLSTNGTNASWEAAQGGYATIVTAVAVNPAQNNTHYLTNTTSSAFTVTLPAGTVGMRIKISDDRGTWDVNNLTIQPASGDRIFPLASNAPLVCNVIRGWVEIVHDGVGWSPNSLASTTLGGGGSGLTGVPVTTTVATAQNGIMYQADTTGGAFSITLPGGTSAAVIGVLDAGPRFTQNNLTIIPATGQAISDGAVNQSLIMDGNNQSIVLYRANGATVWEIQVTPAVQYTPGFQPAYSGSAPIGDDFVGYTVKNTAVAFATSDGTEVIQTLLTNVKPGKYLAIAQGNITCQAGGTISNLNHTITLRIGATNVLQESIPAYFVTGTNVTGASFALPTIVTPISIDVAQDVKVGINPRYTGSAPSLGVTLKLVRL